MSKALAVRESIGIMDLADVLVKSGFFTDIRDQAKAVVKVLAGQELGFGPIASMTGIHIVQGRPVLSANLMAAMIKRSPTYNYRVTSHTDQECVIEFYENGEKVGVSTFTIEDAKAAGLMGGTNWKKYPRNMLFARALSNGVKWHCPDVLGGPAYTPDEFDAEVDEHGDAVIEWQEIGSDNGSKPAQATFADWVVETKTPKGTPYIHLNVGQLKQIVEAVQKKSPSGSREEEAANTIINVREFAYRALAPAIVDAGYAENEFNAVGMLRHSALNGDEGQEVTFGWCASYRGARDAGKEVGEASEIANSELLAGAGE